MIPPIVFVPFRLFGSVRFFRIVLSSRFTLQYKTYFSTLSFYWQPVFDYLIFISYLRFLLYNQIQIIKPFIWYVSILPSLGPMTHTP